MEDQANYGNDSYSYQEKGTLIPNYIIHDVEMPTEAFRLLTYFMSFPGEKIKPEFLRTHINLTEKQITNSLSWLIQHNFLTKS